MSRTRTHRILAALAAAPGGRLRLFEVSAAQPAEFNANARNLTTLQALRARGCVTKDADKGGHWTITPRGLTDLEQLDGAGAGARLPAEKRPTPPSRWGTSRKAMGKPLPDAQVVVTRPAIDGEAPRHIANSPFTWAQTLGELISVEEGNHV